MLLLANFSTIFAFKVSDFIINKLALEEKVLTKSCYDSQNKNLQSQLILVNLLWNIKQESMLIF